MKSALIDAGPIIALFDRSDRYHDEMKRLFRTTRRRFVSTWPVITEAAHLLDFDVRAQTGMLDWIDRGGLELFPLTSSHVPRIRDLFEKYRDAPMDLADAGLILAAEEAGIDEIVSIDSDFFVYRTGKGKMLRNLFTG